MNIEHLNSEQYGKKEKFVRILVLSIVHLSVFNVHCAQRIFASVAQSVEQWTENPCVGGSIPPGGTIKHNIPQ